MKDTWGVYVACELCNGTGWDKAPYDGGRKVCHKCGGAGRIKKEHKSE